MNRSTKLLGLMAATAMVLPMGQAAGQPPKLIEVESPENLELKQAQPNAESRPPSEGTLAEGDQVLREDGRRFDSYSFQGNAGTTIRITVTSQVFAPFVFLVDRTTGETIAQQVGDSDTVSLTVQLPNDGEYEFGVAAIEAPGEGAYQFNVVRVQAATGPQAEAYRLLAQGGQQYENGQLEEAISSWEQALQLYEELGDLETRRIVLTNLSVAWTELLNRYFGTNDYQRIIETAEPLLLILVELGDRAGESSILGGLGVAYKELGDYERAIELHQQALEIARQLDDKTLQARALNNLGVAYRGISEYQLAIEAYEESLTIAREVNDIERQGNTWSNLGNLYVETEDYEQAVKAYEQGLLFFREAGNQSNEFSVLFRLADAYGQLGFEYIELGDFGAATELFQKSLDIALRFNDRVGEAVALNGFGEIERSKGNHGFAIDYFQQSFEIFHELGDVENSMISLYDLGSSYFDSGEYSQSIDSFQQYLMLARDINDSDKEASALNQLGIVYRNLSDYQSAIFYFREVLSLALENNYLDLQALALGNLGNIYSRFGNYQQSLDLYAEALELARSQENQLQEGRILGNIGASLVNSGNYQRATDIYEQRLSIARSIEDRPGIVAALVALGRIRHRFGGYPLSYYLEALETAEQIGQPALLLDVLRLLGDSRIRVDEYSQFGDEYTADSITVCVGACLDHRITYYEKALELAQSINARDTEASILLDIAHAYLEGEQPNVAESYLIKAVHILDEVRNKLDEDSDRISLFQTQISAFSLLQEALAEQGKSEAALEVAERGRGRALVTLLSQQIANDSVDIAPEITPNINTIKQTARQTSSTLVTYSVIRDVDQSYQLNRVFSGLDIGQEFNYSIYIWVVSPDGSVVFRELILNGFDLEGLIADTRDVMGVGDVDRAIAIPSIAPNQSAQDLAQRRAETDENLRQLHQVLIDPIADLLPTDPDEKVAFIPQGELFLVPFPALKDANGQYLIKNHTILTAPSIQVLQLTQDLAGFDSAQPATGAGIESANPLIVGDPAMPTVTFLSEAGDFESVRLQPLYGARQEAEAVGDTLNASALLGDAATEARVKQQIASADLIHLATHGLLEYGDPRQTGSRDTPGAIALAPGNGEDGLLTSTEILQMELQADLVVLSACDTGRGRITGDGVIGLSRSFIAAGVPSVIVSLWAVPDAPTADLMRAFYDQLAQGETKVQALRQAMLITMQTRPDPKDWAAFTLIGNAE